MRTSTTVPPRRRRFFLVLPLLVLPFLAMAFWALGGGDTSHPTDRSTGLNLELPAAQPETTRLQDKLSLYEELGKRLHAKSPDKRSLLQELVPWDLPGPGPGDTSAGSLQGPPLPPEDMGAAFAGTFDSTGPERHEAGINERLTRLTALVNGDIPPSRAERQTANRTPAHSAGQGEGLRQDIDRLERLMQDISSQPTPADPEVQQLEGMLDRILDIQHPERVQARLLQQSGENSRQLFPLYPLPAGPPVTLLGESKETAVQVSGSPPGQSRGERGAIQGTFHGLDESHAEGTTPGNYLAAVIREKQKVTSGSTVQLRLLQDAYLGGHLLPAGTQLHGTCRMQGERLFISVSSVRRGNTLLPVALSAHDLDGMEGLYVPGALNQQVAGQGAQQVLSQGLPLPPLTPSLGAQAASAGIETARNLFSRKARLVKVMLPPGYRLYLLDQHTPR
jgi:conjugative transposon TraM protein